MRLAAPNPSPRFALSLPPWIKLEYLAIAAVALVLVVLIHARESQELDQEIASYRREAHERTQALADDLQHAITLTYQGLRTIARLPGVRKIDRYARNFDADARRTVQEIYNNLASNVSVSEVYIVPVGMDPDQADPVTGKPQEPIITFDELIVGRHAEATRDLKHSQAPAVSVPEVETYEYRLMRQQLQILQTHFASDSMCAPWTIRSLPAPR